MSKEDFKDMQPQIDRILSQLERLNKLDKKCSTCRSWFRGGIGVGRGGGWCSRWKIPKTPGNRVTNEAVDCWVISRVYLNKIRKSEDSKERVNNV